MNTAQAPEQRRKLRLRRRSFPPQRHSFGAEEAAGRAQAVERAGRRTRLESDNLKQSPVNVYLLTTDPVYQYFRQHISTVAER